MNQLPNYDIDKSLPPIRGAYGSVRCIILRDGSKVAEKKLTSVDVFADDWELDILQRLRHPNCVELYACFKQETFNELTLLTAPWSQCDLQHLLRSDATKSIPNLTKFCKNRAEFYLNLAAGTLSGVEYLHTNHLVHNDLKPSNILIYCDLENHEDYPTPKITDFGCSSRVHLHSSSNFTDSQCRSPFYYSPERLSGSGRKTSRRGDLWSLGIVLLELFMKVAVKGKGWQKMIHADKGFGLMGPATSYRKDYALWETLREMTSAISDAPLPPLFKELEKLFTQDPYARGTVSEFIKKFQLVIQAEAPELVIVKKPGEVAENWRDAPKDTLDMGDEEGISSTESLLSEQADGLVAKDAAPGSGLDLAEAVEA